MHLVGATPSARMDGTAELPGKANYLIGSDPQRWRTNVPTYARACARQIYSGVDLVYYGTKGQLEYDFVVAPGADPSAIALTLDDGPSHPAGRWRISANGDLVYHAAPGDEIRFRKPVVYQERTSAHWDLSMARTREFLPGQYVLTGGNRIQFAVGRYDRTRPLIIDPVLVYSTYLGGGGRDVGNGIAVDAAGAVYITGSTSSANFPTFSPVQPTNHGGSTGKDAFVAKLNAKGTALAYSTYLGGTGDDEAEGIAVDRLGNAYVTGYTLSTDFPTAHPLQASRHGSADAFVAELNPTGSTLVYSTYLGGAGYDQGNAIAVDSTGNAYIAGLTGSTDWPTLKAVQTVNHAGAAGSAFVAKIKVGGSALSYSTYLGGSGCNSGQAGDEAFGIAVDALGHAYVTGSTASPDFPTLDPLQPANNANSMFCGTNAFVAKLSTAGSSLNYSTYLGGFAGPNGEDAGNAIAVDASGNTYVTGVAGSSNFPTVNAYQPATHSTGSLAGNVFVSKINSAGSALVYSTYLGGSGGAFGGDLGKSVSVDPSGNVYVTGTTRSANFPTTATAPQKTASAGPQGVQTAFVSKLNASGSALLFSTYLGGSGGDSGNAIAVDAAGDAYVTGGTSSANFLTAKPLQPSLLGASNAFITKLSTNAKGATLAVFESAASLTFHGSLLTYTIWVANTGDSPAGSLSISDPVPPGATFHSVSFSAGSCVAPVLGGQGTVVCTAPRLASAALITERLVVQVTAAPGAKITDTVTAQIAGDSEIATAQASTSVIKFR